MRTLAILAAATALTGAASAAPITSQSFFSGSSDVVIDFDSLAPNTDLSTQITGLVFSSEDEIGTLNTTDAADASGRFEDDMKVLNTVGGGGSPSSSPNYTSGGLFLGPANNGQNVADIRIDFTDAVAAVGMQIIDNDFSTGRLSAYAADGSLLETVIVPQVGEGGSAFWGIDATGLGSLIAYIIYDGPGNAAIDSTFFDDLSYRPGSAIPVPGALPLFAAGLLFLRRRKA
ncbi:hypothetical protein HK107_08155 [Parvularcula sp. ZS-1/3]|uniref:VPLPA-CTERM sorting domain-containing protein n=1 Tax=Parvularcula mediterranea TaxID=2732508 RepID=A0A7Y3RLH3_9PROT|nr:hypothetical protein [Parvularcula mediterranea]NNU16292.1 hypothetical protein [Parvularcula mediterranea]